MRFGMTKKWFCAMALLGGVLVVQGAADDVSMAESEAFMLDTRAGKGAIPSDGTDTQCLLGFGGTLGLVAGLTECLGLYAEVGYEWIDGAETSLGGLQAEVDYSSLVVSAGLVFSF